MFPVQNATGGPAPVKPLTDALEAALRVRGVEILPRRDLDILLAKHRIRFTGGVDRKMAKVLREELGVEAVLVPTLETYAADAPPKVALAVRAATTGERPLVAWADAVARSGDDSPGLLARGIVTSVGELERAVIARVAGSIERWIETGAPGEACGGAGRFRPRRSFRATALDDLGRRTVAVLPFTNETARRGPAEVVFGQFVAQLARSGAFEVLDPGFVREELLGHRIVLENGVSLDNATTLLALLDADLVISGYVQLYEPRSGPAAPRVEFTSYALDRSTQELVWSSASEAYGDQGVFFFGAGRVRSPATLSCRMVRGVVDRIVGERPPLPPDG
jgi:hypothetical protein